MNYAIVDTGSNTIRMSIYDVEGESFCEIFTEAIFANLASHIKDGKITDTGIDVCADALLAHEKTAKKHDAEVYAFATAAIRNAKNSHEAIEKIKEKTGITMEILSGDDEGILSFLGAYEDFGIKNGVMADVGGGSSEIIAFSNGQPTRIHSVPWGSLKSYKGFVSGEIPTFSEVEKIKSEITKHLKDTMDGINAEDLCLVGGGVRIARKLSQMFLGSGDLNQESIDKMIEIFINDPEIMKIFEEVSPKRKYTIIPGLAIYSAIGEFFGTDKIYISDKGIKEGYLKMRVIH